MMRLAAVALLLAVGCGAAPAPDKSVPAALYGAPAAPACPLQRVEAATGYGCEESEECSTQYEEKCETEYQQECSTSYEQKCSTEYDTKCETKYDTVYEDSCVTKYDTVYE